MRFLKALVPGVVGATLLASTSFNPAVAAPTSVVRADVLSPGAPIVEARYRGRRVVHRRNAGVPAAFLGAFAAIAGAVIANSRSDDYGYGYGYGYPQYGYSYPAYGYASPAYAYGGYRGGYRGGVVYRGGGYRGHRGGYAHAAGVAGVHSGRHIR